MMRLLLWGLAPWSVLSFAPAFGAGEAAAELSVMTFNLRFASSQSPNAWPDRLPVALAMIKQQQPDLIGTQEGLYHQLKDLQSGLSDYRWIGLGRRGGSRGEFMAVWYRTEKLEPIEFDHFWLSSTPEVIASTSFGNQLPRMVTWVRFRHRETEREFYVFNTHFDHRSQPSREQSAQLVLEQIEKLDTELPVLLVGDFNAAAGRNVVYDQFVGADKLVDTWQLTENKGPELATMHAYRGPQPGAGRIDWILGRGIAHVASCEIVTFSVDGQYPSDHFPVVAHLRLAQ